MGEYETINLYVGFMRGWRLTTCYFSRGAVKITITGAFLATSSVLFLFWCQLGNSWYTCCMLPAVHHTQSQQNVDCLERLPSRAVGHHGGAKKWVNIKLAFIRWTKNQTNTQTKKHFKWTLMLLCIFWVHKLATACWCISYNKLLKW